MKDYLLCYDIADDTRLYYVRKFAYALALGGQKSALETPLSSHEAKRILNTLPNSNTSSPRSTLTRLSVKYLKMQVGLMK